MNPYIFGINIICGMYMSTPISVFMSIPKKAKNGSLTRQTLGATHLIYGMHIQLDFESNIGWIPPGYTSSHWCVKRKVSKKNF